MVNPYCLKISVRDIGLKGGPKLNGDSAVLKCVNEFEV